MEQEQEGIFDIRLEDGTVIFSGNARAIAEEISKLHLAKIKAKDGIVAYMTEENLEARIRDIQIGLEEQVKELGEIPWRLKVDL